MKETRSLLNSLVVCGVALAMVSTLVAQTATQGTGKVVRLKGAVRYSTGNNVWQPIKVGDVVKPGTTIQTAANASIDIALGDSAASTPRPVPGEMLSYQPNADQNMFRLWENTLLSVDKLTIIQTGSDEVTETQLDLKAGHIFGSVKKMSAASKYEVKIPNGVAGIRGTTYDISAEGVVKVLVGSVVLAYVGAGGTMTTQVVMNNEQFDARTGALTALPANFDKSGLKAVTPRSQPILVPAPPPFVSPH